MENEGENIQTLQNSSEMERKEFGLIKRTKTTEKQKGIFKIKKLMTKKRAAVEEREA